ncbi:MAG: hypothetical protein NT157_06980 [Candidatus Micrarchaeota archaeon]|nr:hypothetical protein [Candidatus Micrarchaeota archaeon]
MKTTIAAFMLALIVGIAFGFGVAPTVDSAAVVQGGSVTNDYEAWELEDGTTIGTSVSWAVPNVTRAPEGSAELKFSVKFSPSASVVPGNYTIITTISSGGDIKTIKTDVEVKEYLWAYDYLKAGETYDNVRILDFAYGGQEYGIVKVNGKEVLIGKEDAAVEDEALIRNVSTGYYLATYYPPEIELARLSSLISIFNVSRNTIGQFGPAEDMCKTFLGLKVLPCYDLTTCKLACRASHSEDIGICEDPTLISSVYDFSLGTKYMDGNLSNSVALIGNMTLQSAVNDMKTVKKDLENVRSTAQALLGSPLRYEQTCMTCYAMCPIMLYNMTSINEAITKAGSFYTKMAGAGAGEDFVNGLVNSSLDRIDYSGDTAHRKALEARYEGARNTEIGLTSRITNITSLLSSSELTIKLNSLTGVSAEIYSIIENDSYDDPAALDAELNTLFTRFDRIAGEAGTLLASVSAPYDEMLAQREQARKLMLRAELNTVQGDSSDAQIKALAERYGEAEARRAGKPAENEIGEMKDEYAAIAAEAGGIVGSKPGDTFTEAAAELFNDASLSVGYALMGLAGKTSYADRIGAAPIIPVVGIGLMTLLVVAITAGALTIYVLRHRRNMRAIRKRLALFGVFCAGICFITVMAAVTMYYVIDQSSGPRIWNSFSDELAGAARVSVFMDTGSAMNAPDAGSAQEAVVSCGSRMADAMPGKQVIEYTIIGEECMAANETLTKAQCMDEAWGAPYFYVSYAGANKMDFRSLYETKAAVSGDAEYLGDCLLAEVMRGG